MKGHDPIATPTLARLYLTQGYLDRARAVLADCLGEDPFDGDALVLQHRLAAQDHGALHLSVHEHRLHLSWTGIPAPTENSVILMVFPQVNGASPPWVTSTPCGKSFGDWDVSPPFVRGSACACIASAMGAKGFAVEAVARPISWP